VDGSGRGPPYGRAVLAVDRVYAAARAASADDDTAAAATSHVLRADPLGRPDVLAARGACLAAGRRPHRAYAPMEPGDREAVVLARVLGWTTDRIAAQLGTTEADVRARLARGLRTLLPPRGCAAAASPARAARAS
jgi:DNA-directed RNA polymerase specialized sigma24 family protein